MNFIAKDIAIAFVFAITGWMLKTYLNHQEKMKGLDDAAGPRVIG